MPAEEAYGQSRDGYLDVEVMDWIRSKQGLHAHMWAKELIYLRRSGSQRGAYLIQGSFQVAVHPSKIRNPFGEAFEHSNMGSPRK